MSLRTHIERAAKGCLHALLKALPRPDPAGREAVRGILERPGAHLLIVRQHHKMGDLLCATPVMSNLKAHAPDLKISFLAGHYNAAAIAHNPFVDRLIVMPRAWWKFPAFLLRLRRLRPDLSIVLTTNCASLTSALLARLSGAGIVLGQDTGVYNRPYSRYFYNLALPYAHSKGEHMVEVNLKLLQELGIPAENREHCLGSSPQAKQWVDRYLAGLDWRMMPFQRDAGMGAPPPHLAGRGLSEATGPLIGIHPAGSPTQPGRLVDHGIFATLAQQLHQQLRARILVVHSPQERRLAGAFREKAGIACRDFCADLDKLKALAERLDLFICNDGGSMHLVGGAGAPTLAFFKLADPAEWTPHGGRVAALDVRALGDQLEAVLPRALEQAHRLLTRGRIKGGASGA